MFTKSQEGCRGDYWGFPLAGNCWCRLGVEMAFQLFTVSLREVLPCIAIPLREGEDEVKLDLQWVFNQAYDRGPYRRGAVDLAVGHHPSDV